MTLLIDTNIILDVLLARPEFVNASSLIWKLCETEFPSEQSPCLAAG